MLGCSFLLVACIAARAEPVEIVFASGPDASGTVQGMVDAFNQANDGKIRIAWKVMDRDSGAHRKALLAALDSKSSSIHVFASDVVWTAEIAKRRDVIDLTRRFYQSFSPDDFVEPALESATHRLRIWGVPWYVDVGVLYRRTDLLKKSGYDDAPATWSELSAMAKKTMTQSGVPHGFVFQGAAYEGGTANALEYIWSAGGRVMTGQLVVTGAFGQSAIESAVLTVASDEAAAGLDIARQLVADGISPKAVADFREKEALDEFLAGRAVFLRSWPYVNGLIAGSDLSPDQVGVSALPSVSPSGGRYGCLGGWNLMIDADADAASQDAAWSFIRFLVDPARQKHQGHRAGLLPSRRGVYDDEELRRAQPVIDLGRELLGGGIRYRPRTTFHAELSEIIAREFRAVLLAETSGREAVERIDRDLRILLGRYR